MEPDGQEHASTTVHAAEPTDIADIRLRLVQLEDIVSVHLELTDDNITNMYLLPLEQTQALVATAAGLLARAGRATNINPVSV